MRSFRKITVNLSRINASLIYLRSSICHQRLARKMQPQAWDDSANQRTIQSPKCHNRHMNSKLTIRRCSFAGRVVSQKSSVPHPSCRRRQKRAYSFSGDPDGRFHFGAHSVMRGASLPCRNGSVRQFSLVMMFWLLAQAGLAHSFSTRHPLRSPGTGFVLKYVFFCVPTMEVTCLKRECSRKGDGCCSRLLA